MIIRKPSVLLSAYNSFASFPQTSGSSTSSCRRHQESTRQQRGRGNGSRNYATIAGDEHHDDHRHHEQRKEPEHKWPQPLAGQTHPTPYQIFAMKSTATYSKTHFYKLAKMYHPDSSSDALVPHHVRLERYRLIVAAHAILSDPTKRSAYDRLGAGWNGKAEVDSNGNSKHPGPGPFSHSWSDHSNPIWQNATWEDWERFYARRAREAGGTDQSNTDWRRWRREHQGPLYMSNSYFIILVSILAMIGSSLNYGRAQDAGTYFVEQRDLVHDRAAKELRKVRQEMQGMNGREERIQWFIRNREAQMGHMAGTDVEAMRDEKAQRVLPQGEVCRSYGVSDDT